MPRPNPTPWNTAVADLITKAIKTLLKAYHSHAVATISASTRRLATNVSITTSSASSTRISELDARDLSLHHSAHYPAQLAYSNTPSISTANPQLPTESTTQPISIFLSNSWHATFPAQRDSLAQLDSNACRLFPHAHPRSSLKSLPFAIHMRG